MGGLSDRKKHVDVMLLRKDNLWGERAEEFLNGIFDKIVSFYGNKKYQPIPDETYFYTGNLLISFLSPWIVPKEILDSFNYAINFHPAPPKYPGTGGYNFAIYNGDKEYGITVHFMTEKVDSGKIIYVQYFPIFQNDTVISLQQRTLDYLLLSLYKVLYVFLTEGSFPFSDLKWEREPYTRKDLERLCEISCDMEENEIERRIRATYYPGRPGAFVKVGKYKFYFVDKWDW